MEQEKLREAEKTFQEDKEKFQKYTAELELKAKQVHDDVKKLNDQKFQKMDEIMKLKAEKKAKKSKMNQVVEELSQYVQYKMFVKGLAAHLREGDVQMLEKGRERGVNF